MTRVDERHLQGRRRQAAIAVPARIDCAGRMLLLMVAPLCTAVAVYLHSAPGNVIRPDYRRLGITQPRHGSELSHSPTGFGARCATRCRLRRPAVFYFPVPMASRRSTALSRSWRRSAGRHLFAHFSLGAGHQLSADARVRLITRSSEPRCKRLRPDDNPHTLSCRHRQACGRRGLGHDHLLGRAVHVTLRYMRPRRRWRGDGAAW